VGSLRRDSRPRNERVGWKKTPAEKEKMDGKGVCVCGNIQGDRDGKFGFRHGEPKNQGHEKIVLCGGDTHKILLKKSYDKRASTLEIRQ